MLLSLSSQIFVVQSIYALWSAYVGSFKKSSSSFSHLLMHSSSNYFILLTIENTFLCFSILVVLNTLSQSGVLFPFNPNKNFTLADLFDSALIPILFCFNPYLFPGKSNSKLQDIRNSIFFHFGIIS